MNQAKLTEDEVRQIIEDMVEGKTNKELAETYGVTKGCMSLIRCKRKWKHVSLGIDIPSDKRIKMTPVKRDEMYQKYIQGMSHKELAFQYDVSAHYINCLIYMQNEARRLSRSQAPE